MLIVLIFIAAILTAILGALSGCIGVGLRIRKELHTLRSRIGKHTEAVCAISDIGPALDGGLDRMGGLIKSTSEISDAAVRKISEDNQKAHSDLSTALEGLTGYTKRIAAFSEGQDKIALSLVEAVTSLEVSVTDFVRHAFGVEGGRGKGKSFTDLAAENTIDRLMQGGFSREEAMQHVRMARAGEVPE